MASAEYTVIHERPESFYDRFERKADLRQQTHYCPGCGHGIAHKLIAEAIDELGIRDRTIFVSPVGCSVFAYYYFDTGNVQAAHGRASAVATAVKRTRPESIVLAYQGDGDLAAIGTAEIIHAANRGEHVTIFFLNNAIYGMTGGQMAPTTLIGAKTTTTPFGRNPLTDGYPLHVSEMLATLEAPVYIERVALGNNKQIMQAAKAVKKAIRNQIDGLGFSLVEILSPCPTVWKMEPLDAQRYVHDELTKVFPTAVFRDRTKEVPPGPAPPTLRDIRTVLGIDCRASLPPPVPSAPRPPSAPSAVRVSPASRCAVVSPPAWCPPALFVPGLVGPGASASRYRFSAPFVLRGLGGLVGRGAGALPLGWRRFWLLGGSSRPALPPGRPGVAAWGPASAPAAAGRPGRGRRPGRLAARRSPLPGPPPLPLRAAAPATRSAVRRSPRRWRRASPVGPRPVGRRRRARSPRRPALRSPAAAPVAHLCRCARPPRLRCARRALARGSARRVRHGALGPRSPSPPRPRAAARSRRPAPCAPVAPPGQRHCPPTAATPASSTAPSLHPPAHLALGQPSARLTNRWPSPELRRS